MVHTVIAETKVELFLKKLLSSEGVHVGVVVGQSTARAKDHILLAVSTPSLQDLKENEEKQSSLPSSHFEDWWVIEHAKQVVNLLPGGLNVVGVFCVCSSEVFTTVQSRMASLLSQLTSHPHTILLHICALSGRTKALVLHEQRAGFQPAEMKFQSAPMQLIKVESSIKLTSDWYASLLSKTPQKLLKNVQATAVNSLEEVFSSTLIRVNGRFVEEGDSLLPKAKKGEPCVPEGGIKMDLFTKHLIDGIESVELLTNSRRVELSGCLPLTAYLHTKATFSNAIKAVKEDACRCLTSQLVALAEADSVQEISKGVSLSLPCRVSVTVPSISWPLSEYTLPGEDIKECEGRVCDLLGVVSATSISLSPPLALEESVTELSSPEPTSNKLKSESSSLWMLIGAVIALLVAITIWVFVS